MCRNYIDKVSSKESTLRNRELAGGTSVGVDLVARVLVVTIVDDLVGARKSVGGNVPLNLGVSSVSNVVEPELGLPSVISGDRDPSSVALELQDVEVGPLGVKVVAGVSSPEDDLSGRSARIRRTNVLGNGSEGLTLRNLIRGRSGLKVENGRGDVLRLSRGRRSHSLDHAVRKIRVEHLVGIESVGTENGGSSFVTLISVLLASGNVMSVRVRKSSDNEMGIGSPSTGISNGGDDGLAQTTARHGRELTRHCNDPELTNTEDLQGDDTLRPLTREHDASREDKDGLGGVAVQIFLSGRSKDLGRQPVPVPVLARRVGTLNKVEHTRTVSGSSGEGVSKGTSASLYRLSNTRVFGSDGLVFHVDPNVHVLDLSLKVSSRALGVETSNRIELILSNHLGGIKISLAGSITMATLAPTSASRVRLFTRHTVIAEGSTSVGADVSFVGLSDGSNKVLVELRELLLEQLRAVALVVSRNVAVGVVHGSSVNSEPSNHSVGRRRNAVRALHDQGSELLIGVMLVHGALRNGVTEVSGGTAVGVRLKQVSALVPNFALSLSVGVRLLDGLDDTAHNGLKVLVMETICRDIVHRMP